MSKCLWYLSSQEETFARCWGIRDADRDNAFVPKKQPSAKDLSKDLLLFLTSLKSSSWPEARLKPTFEWCIARLHPQLLLPSPKSSILWCHLLSLAWYTPTCLLDDSKRFSSFRQLSPSSLLFFTIVAIVNSSLTSVRSRMYWRNLWISKVARHENNDVFMRASFLSFALTVQSFLSLCTRILVLLRALTPQP